VPSLLLVFLQSLCTVLYSGYITLHSHQQCMRVPFSLPPCQHLLLFEFLMVVILTGVRWNLWFAFPLWLGWWAFLHVFFCHLDFFLWKSSVQFICLFLHWVTDFLGEFSFLSSCKFWLIIPVRCIAGKDFLPFCGLSLLSGDCFLCCAEAF
jgi:hypothetical protein